MTAPDDTAAGVPDVGDLERMLKAATPGPWVHIAVKGGWDGVGTADREDVICNLSLNTPANADLIAIAPSLAAEVIALRKRVEDADALADLLEQVQRQGCEVCSGDCSSAMPPVGYCPMKERKNFLAAYRAGAKP